MNVFLNFLKYFGIMLAVLVAGITCVGSIVSGDTLFVVTGIISSVMFVVGIFLYIRKRSKKEAPVPKFFK